MANLSRQLHQHFGGLPRLVMFDLDGTLVDSVPDLAAAIDAMLADLSRQSAGEEKVRQWVGNGAQVLVQRALANRIDVNFDALQGQTLVEQQAAHQLFLKHYRSISGRFSGLYPGVLQCLKKLQEADVTLAVITNKPVEFVPRLLSHLGIDSYFSDYLGGDSLELKKPHPQPLIYLLDRFGLNANQALMVGDSRNDIEAARAAGVASLAVTYGYNHGRPVAEERPDFICDSLEQLFT